MNVYNTEEIDLFLWNNGFQNGFYFLPSIILVECKNWSSSVGSSEVSYFITKLQNRGRNYGILIATNGITGSNNPPTAAEHLISVALTRGIHVIVITQEEIENLRTTVDLILLIKIKIMELVISGSSL